MKNKNSLFNQIIKHRNLYIMVLPCVVFFIIFSYVPMVGIITAFKDYSFSRGIFNSSWAANNGFKYFLDFFNYYDFTNLIRNTFVAGFFKAILPFPFPIIFALLLNEIRNKSFKKTVQTISYFPYFISWVIVSVMIFRILAPNDGIVNQIFGILGLKTDTYFIMEGKYFYPILFLSYLWKNIGWNSIIYLAAISSVNPEYYEAAKIDGAKKLSQIWHITLAGIKPTMGILFILALGSVAATGFEQNYLLRTPGNMHVADILDTFVIKQGFERGAYSYATAIGLMQGITSLIMVTTANKLSRKFLEISIW
jgi:putative aldouronate transport system permease protein